MKKKKKDRDSSENDATLEKKGVSGEEVLEEEASGEEELTKPPTKPHYMTRLEALEQVAKSADEEREEDLVGVDEFEAAEAESEEKEPPEVEEEGEEEEEAEEEEEETVTLMIDGEQVEVPVSEVLELGKRAAQKELAADKRLEEATRLLEEAKQRAQALTGEEQPQEEQPQEEQQQKPPLTEEEKQEIAKALLYGEEKDVAAALDKLFEAVGKLASPKQQQQGDEQPALTPEVVFQAVEAELHLKDIRDKFLRPPEEGGYGDLTQDPMVWDMTVKLVDQKLANGAPNTWETYAQAGEEVRKWLKSVAGKVVGAQSFDDKKARKKKVENIKAATARAAVEEPKEPTPSDIIKEMRKARGQPVY